MLDTTTIKMGQRGVVTFPKAWRENYNLRVGARLTLIDLGGVFVLSPHRSQVDELAGQLAQNLAAQGESLESMLLVLREERERYGRQD